VQPRALDRGDADGAAVPLGDEDAAAEVPPAGAYLIVRVRELGGREDVRERADGGLALEREVGFRLVRARVADGQRRRCSSIASRTIVGKS
jgi:hypothetical protein